MGILSKRINMHKSIAWISKIGEEKGVECIWRNNDWNISKFEEGQVYLKKKLNKQVGETHRDHSTTYYTQIVECQESWVAKQCNLKAIVAAGQEVGWCMKNAKKKNYQPRILCAPKLSFWNIERN